MSSHLNRTSHYIEAGCQDWIACILFFKRINAWNIFENYCPGNFLSPNAGKTGHHPRKLKTWKNRKVHFKDIPPSYIYHILPCDQDIYSLREEWEFFKSNKNKFFKGILLISSRKDGLAYSCGSENQAIYSHSSEDFLAKH